MPSIHCSLLLEFALEVLISGPVEGTICPLEKQSLNISEAQISVMLCVIFEGLVSYRALQLVC